MNIAVIGTGYVGLVVGACLSETGNDVVCADVSEEKISGLQQNVIPIYEPGLESLVERNQAQGRLRFTTDISAAIGDASVVFIAVGTPPGEDGSADLQHVLDVARSIGQHMARELVVVTKSTVPVGTAAKVEAEIAREARYPFHMCSNPEFLKEGAAVEDFMKPDRVVIGIDSEYAKIQMAELYAPFVRTGKPVIFMDIPSAEMTKYAANGMLATRISFMNEVAHLCELTGADVDLVRKGIGTDARIGPSFLFPGPGYGGSCFPKDVRALLRMAEELGAPLDVLTGVHTANERQKMRISSKVRAAVGDALEGTRIAIWGLSFKPQTDDMREAPSLVVIEELLQGGATVCAHDPAAMEAARRWFKDRIEYADTNYDALPEADALVVMTDWNEYRHPDLERVRALLRRPVVVDARNLYEPAKMRGLGFVYYSVGRRPVESNVAQPVG
jgi:UDPglucose 6-dehydrogenase